MRDKRIHSPFFRSFLLPRLAFFCVGFIKGSFFSIDVTKRCNLRCKHCYFYRTESPEELSPEAWENRLKELKKNYKLTYSATWIGGEPLLRQDVIERCKGLFMHNLLVTNGTIPFPTWPNVYYHVSIDGDEKTHDEVRGKKGLYRSILNNISNAPADIKISAAMCINELNKGTIEGVIKDLYDSNVNEVMFDFYTPSIKEPNDPLAMTNKAKEDTIRHILDLKKNSKYGAVIDLPNDVLLNMMPKNMKKVVSKCSFRSHGVALDTGGNIKPKCMMGAEADCSKCGCIVPYYLHYRKDKIQIIKSVFQEVHKRTRDKIRSGQDS